jgi:hypothetical protein
VPGDHRRGVRRHQRAMKQGGERSGESRREGGRKRGGVGREEDGNRERKEECKDPARKGGSLYHFT